MVEPQYWIVKQEPSDFSWVDFVREGGAAWTGIRNYAARKHLRSMRPGDLVLFYHSGEEKSLVGLARATKPAYPDPTAPGEDWSAVDLVPVKPLQLPVTLQTLKADPVLNKIALVKQSRLSVSPITAAEFRQILSLAKTEAGALR